jgi:hypothetical protein
MQVRTIESVALDPVRCRLGKYPPPKVNTLRSAGALAIKKSTDFEIDARPRHAEKVLFCYIFNEARGMGLHRSAKFMLGA